MFFTAADKVGGPTEIFQGFQYVYTEIFIRKSTQLKSIKNQSDMNDDCEDDDSESKRDYTKTE